MVKIVPDYIGTKHICLKNFEKLWKSYWSSFIYHTLRLVRLVSGSGTMRNNLKVRIRIRNKSRLIHNTATATNILIIIDKKTYAVENCQYYGIRQDKNPSPRFGTPPQLWLLPDLLKCGTAVFAKVLAALLSLFFLLLDFLFPENICWFPNVIKPWGAHLRSNSVDHAVGKAEGGLVDFPRLGSHVLV